MTPADAARVRAALVSAMALAETEADLAAWWRDRRTQDALRRLPSDERQAVVRAKDRA
jgi:hypothetical protein